MDGSLPAIPLDYWQHLAQDVHLLRILERDFVLCQVHLEEKPRRLCITNTVRSILELLAGEGNQENGVGT